MMPCLCCSVCCQVRKEPECVHELHSILVQPAAVSAAVLVLGMSLLRNDNDSLSPEHMQRVLTRALLHTHVHCSYGSKRSCLGNAAAAVYCTAVGVRACRKTVCHPSSYWQC
jgi:hypothetical protein